MRRTDFGPPTARIGTQNTAPPKGPLIINELQHAEKQLYACAIGRTDAEARLTRQANIIL